MAGRKDAGNRIRKMEDRVWHGSIIGLERFQDEQKAYHTCNSIIMRRVKGSESVPFSYVATRVAKLATFCKDANSSSRLSSSVRISDCKRSAQNLQWPARSETRHRENSPCHQP